MASGDVTETLRESVRISNIKKLDSIKSWRQAELRDIKCQARERAR